MFAAIEAKKDPELCRLPAPNVPRRKSDLSADSKPNIERPNSLVISSRPRPLPRNNDPRSLSSPSSGSDSPVSATRLADFPKAQDPISANLYPGTLTPTVGPNLPALTPALGYNVGHALTPYSSTTPRLAITGYPQPAPQSPLVMRSNALQQPMLPAICAAPPVEEPSPFDVKFPSPKPRPSPSHLDSEQPPPLPKKTVRFSNSPNFKLPPAPFDTQRSLLDLNMGEEQDIHDPLVRYSPKKELATRDFGSSSGATQLDHIALEREFLSWPGLLPIASGLARKF